MTQLSLEARFLEAHSLCRSGGSGCSMRVSNWLLWALGSGMIVPSYTKGTNGRRYCVGVREDPGFIWGWWHDSLSRNSNETELLFLLSICNPFILLSKTGVDRDTLTLEEAPELLRWEVRKYQVLFLESSMTFCVAVLGAELCPPQIHVLNF